MAGFRLENMFGQKFDKINLDQSTLDQLDWMSQVLGELKLGELKLGELGKYFCQYRKG